MLRYKWIQSHCKETDKIVDIGGNEGHIFNGWDRNNVTTVDLDVYNIPNFVRASAEELPFSDDSFDVAVLAEILEHVEDPDKALSEALRVASKVIITVPYEHKWGKDLRPFHYFDKIVEENDGNLEGEAIKGNPNCVDFYKDDGYKHLFHHRFFSPETLDDFICKNFDGDYFIQEIDNNNMYCIGAVLVK
jgi:SAM-dependent methyltransferase